MSEKKRKRQEDGAGRPAKKASIGKPLGTVRVQHIENKGTVGPVLAATPGVESSSKLLFKAYRSKPKSLNDGESAELLLQSSEHPRLDYLAREEKDGSSNSLLKDYIGVFDPSTSKLQLMEVKKVTMRSSLRSEADELRDEAAQKLTMMAKRNALATEFGSRRSKKALLEMTQNAISRGLADNPDAVKDELVSNAVLQGMESKTSAMPTKQQLEVAVDSAKPRPKANLNAEYPSDVYSIDAVVGKELMSMIPVKDWADASEKGEGVNVSSKFVAKRVVKLCKSKDYQKVKVLKFIALCVNFNSALLSKGRGPKKVPFKDALQTAMGEDVPAGVISAIRRTFTSENNDLPRWNIDKLMTHIVAAALIVDNFEVDMNDLREDLKLELKEIKQYFLELGCRVHVPRETERTKMKLSKAEATSHLIGRLKIPLQFPKVKSGITNAKKR
ncbi:hypothetical protein K504DRAFT_421776 [Pleomassaria siparia CBS 279.74]|uniref:RNA polymerase I associated factor, A49-like protein n=1 Tax=Pleomassaria siparia CBS 279.74 TaxID=1314801 RepID=A0A6G1KRH0_9PLEO|nr:hypothetical protein K504DRAFT_421776 [Pleomassaria siparia CBS 279.74]